MKEQGRFEANRRLYRRLVRRMGLEEKLWLLECKGDYDIYERRLVFLAKKHAVQADQKAY
jgi:hypothetical protein